MLAVTIHIAIYVGGNFTCVLTMSYPWHQQISHKIKLVVLFHFWLHLLGQKLFRNVQERSSLMDSIGWCLYCENDMHICTACGHRNKNTTTFTSLGRSYVLCTYTNTIVTVEIEIKTFCFLSQNNIESICSTWCGFTHGKLSCLQWIQLNINKQMSNVHDIPTTNTCKALVLKITLNGINYK